MEFFIMKDYSSFVPRMQSPTYGTIATLLQRIEGETPCKTENLSSKTNTTDIQP